MHNVIVLTPMGRQIFQEKYLYFMGSSEEARKAALDLEFNIKNRKLRTDISFRLYESIARFPSPQMAQKYMDGLDADTLHEGGEEAADETISQSDKG